MKNFKIVKLMVVAMLLGMAGMAVSSCGSDDDDVIVPGGSDYTEVGVHRIDVSFSGNMDQLNGFMIVLGAKKNDVPSDLYEDGKRIGGGDTFKEWKYTGLRSFSIETESDAVMLSATIGAYSITGGTTTEDITVTVTGYINGKIKARHEIIMPAGSKVLSLVYATVMDNIELGIK